MNYKQNILYKLLTEKKKRKKERKKEKKDRNYLFKNKYIHSKKKGDKINVHIIIN